MSNPKPSEKSINSSPEAMQAEWVTTSTPADYPVTDSTVTGTNLVLFPSNPGLDYDPEELEATDAIAFNFFPPSRSPHLSTPSSAPVRRNLFEGLLTPWGLGGCGCLLLANVLLTLAAIKSPPITPPVASPLNPVAIKPHSSLLSLSSPATPSLNLATLSQLSDPFASQPAVTPAYRIATPPKNTQSSSPAIAAQTVSPPPTVRESLTELLLPPSLQPQYTYSTALPPVTPQTVNPAMVRTQPRQFAPVAVKPRPIQLAPVTVAPPTNLPTIAVPSSYTRQTPPPGNVFPPAQTNSNAVPFSPPIGAGLPPTSNPVNPSVGTPPVNPVSLPNANAASPDGSSSQSSASEQIEQQILSQQKQLQLSQQQATSFNQKIQQNLRSLANQNQELPTTPTDSKTKELVEQLQQLNQPE